MSEYIRLPDGTPGRLVRSGRKSIAIQITPAGEVVVRCPARMGAAEVRRFVQSKEPWIEKHLAALRDRPAQPPLSAEELQDLARQAAEDLPRRAARFAARMGVDYGRVTIRAQRTRWGSCSSQGNLNFNCLLMLTPPEVRDYVVIHELCHRVHMDHSAAFWQQVARFCPDFDDCRQWLKTHGPGLIGRLNRGGTL